MGDKLLAFPSRYAHGHGDRGHDRRFHGHRDWRLRQSGLRLPTSDEASELAELIVGLLAGLRFAERDTCY